ncbi:iron ABC transporter permease [Robbsia sp. KACC 23696]|uniref:FecCD family ABC transporter permease n=1 Tax=Robbsia sp. KACC 23696 TaxID=3149231 RepID=UPI00325AE209
MARASRLTRLVLPLSLLALLISIVVATAFGPVTLAPIDIGRVLLTHVGLGPVDPFVSAATDGIVWSIRLPRVLLGVIVGATLAVTGATLQASTRNVMADPHLLGVSAGAACGAVIATVVAGNLAGQWTLSLFAFIGALLASAAVLILGGWRGALTPSRLLLSGIAVAFTASALANLMLYLGDQRAASSVLFWMLGGLGLARWSLLGVPALCATVGIIWLWARSRALDAMMSGELSATALGIDTARLRRELFVVCALLTAVTVSVSGAIGFVGLVIPHLCRRFSGALHRRLLPLCAVYGALFLIWADVGARVLIAPDDLPIGVITALVGGATLAVLVRRL